MLFPAGAGAVGLTDIASKANAHVCKERNEGVVDCAEVYIESAVEVAVAHVAAIVFVAGVVGVVAVAVTEVLAKEPHHGNQVGAFNLAANAPSKASARKG